MSNGSDDSGSSRGRGGWWSRMSRSEQITAALIGAVITGLFGIIGAVIVSSSGASRSSPPGATSSSPPPATASAPLSSEPGSPSGGSPPAPVASSPALVTYIEDLQATPDSEPYDSRDVAQINGNSYTHSQGAQFCFGSNERKWTYVLGRKYSSFQGTIGLSDNSVSTAKIRFEILADGRPVYSKDLQVGQSAELNVPVSNVLHLELDTTLLTQDGGCGAATGEWANIHAVGP